MTTNKGNMNVSDDKTIRVVYVMNSTLAYSGATKSFLLMLRGLMAHGVVPVVVVPDGGGVAVTLKDMGVRVVIQSFRLNAYPPLDMPKDWMLFLPRLIGRLSLNTLAVGKLKRIFKDDGVDIVHSNVSVIDIGMRLAKALHVPHVYHIREYGDKDFGYHQFPSRTAYLRRLKSDSSWSVFITKALKSYYEMDTNPRARVIYNPIYPESHAATNKEKKPYLLYAGRLDRGKGVFDLIKAYTIYASGASRPLHLHIAGDTDSEDKTIMRNMVRDAGMEDKVVFLGYRDDMTSLMQEATAIVIPSYHEAFGRCLAEAMFNGCLTIGRNTGGTREQYDNGMLHVGREIGLRFSDVNQLAQRMKEVDGMSASQMAQITSDAHKVVTDLYSVENNVREVLKLYQTVDKYI